MGRLCVKKKVNNLKDDDDGDGGEYEHTIMAFN
jgi:hypothetical protein